jgi:hypothetical protein
LNAGYEFHAFGYHSSGGWFNIVRTEGTTRPECLVLAVLEVIERKGAEG